MSSYEDPATMRYVAAQVRRESDLVDATVRRLAARVSTMTYAGPAADQFRSAIHDAGSSGSVVASELAALAAMLEQEAYQAELRQAAIRAAGGMT